MSQKPGTDVESRQFIDLIYVDDTPSFVPSTQEAVWCLSSFSSAASIFGLHLSWPKTKIQNTGSGAQPSNTTVDGNIVEQVDNFIYLSNNQSSDGGSRSDMTWWIALASAAISSLRRIWSDRYLPKSGFTKLLSCQFWHMHVRTAL